MRIFTHFSTPTLTNEYVVADDKGNAIIIDPASVDNSIINIIEDHMLSIKGYFISHNHKENTQGFGTFEKIYPAPVFASSISISGYKTIPIFDKDIITIGEMKIEAIYCPGHSDDSLIYKIGNALFTGDTLYSGSIAETRSNLERERLIKNIKEKILSMNDNTLIMPGRGPLSKVRIEKLYNLDLMDSDALDIESTE